MMMKWINMFVWISGFILVLINYLSFIHAYKLTHFTRKNSDSEKSPYDFSLLEKLSLVLFGFNNPRPKTERKPTIPYAQLTLKGHRDIECWLIEPDNSKGTVVLFHGYSGEKSHYLDRARLFNGMGYSTLLVDFFGSGGSAGSHTTIGYKEAVDVKAAYDYAKNKDPKGETILFGNSMGAVAILKAVKDYNINPDALILECPFGTMLKTIEARFSMMNIPTFPLAHLLAFWGGVQNGFWPFKHNPIQYAKSIKTPTLIFYGEADRRVSREEIDGIFENLSGPKKIRTFLNMGHEDYLLKFRDEWRRESEDFLNALHEKKEASV